MSKILSSEEVADLLGIDAMSVQAKVFTNVLPSYRHWGNTYLLESDLVDYIKQYDKKGKKKEAD